MPRKEQPPIDLQQLLLKEKGPFRIEDLARIAKTGVAVVQQAIDELEGKGYRFGKANDYYYRSNSKSGEGKLNLTKEFPGKYLNFGIVSDTHLSSKKERLDELNAAYDIFEKEGILTVFHPGDITDGWGVYRGQEFEVKHMGQDEQIDYAIKVYPRRKDITTYFITGNHDLRQYERGGVDPGHQISRARKDLVYLGQMGAEVDVSGIEIDLLHPAGGQAYAVSYKAQRQINNLPPNQVPDVLVHGHYHTAFYMHYRGVQFLQAPCFKDAGLFEKRLGLNPVIGAWIVEAVLAEDLSKVERFNPVLFTFDGKPNGK